MLHYTLNFDKFIGQSVFSAKLSSTAAVFSFEEESPSSADFPLVRVENPPLASPIRESRQLANKNLDVESYQLALQPASGESLQLTNQHSSGESQQLTSQQPNDNFSQVVSSQESAGAEFEYESTESSDIVADLVEMQLNKWGRKMAALKAQHVVSEQEVEPTTQETAGSVDFFTELYSGARDTNHSAAFSPSFADSQLKNRPKGGSAQPQVYFRNLTPDGSAVAARPRFLNLRPNGYRTNVEDRLEASFEDVGQEDQGEQLEARLESLGRTGKKYTWPRSCINEHKT
jgi:hypothetical protein